MLIIKYLKKLHKMFPISLLSSQTSFIIIIQTYPNDARKKVLYRTFVCFTNEEPCRVREITAIKRWFINSHLEVLAAIAAGTLQETVSLYGGGGLYGAFSFVLSKWIIRELFNKQALLPGALCYLCMFTLQVLKKHMTLPLSF